MSKATRYRLGFANFEWSDLHGCYVDDMYRFRMEERELIRYGAIPEPKEHVFMISQLKDGTEVKECIGCGVRRPYNPPETQEIEEITESNYRPMWGDEIIMNYFEKKINEIIRWINQQGGK
jgi:hypothetical protein